MDHILGESIQKKGKMARQEVEISHKFFMVKSTEHEKIKAEPK